MSVGVWETRLRALASTDADIVLPNASRLMDGLDYLESTLQSAAGQGLQGQTQIAAARALNDDAQLAQAIASDLDAINRAVESVNSRRRGQAHSELARLDGQAPGALSASDAFILQAAATGATLFFGPLAIVAGPGAVATVNGLLAANRESHARDAVQRVTQMVDWASNEIPEVSEVDDKYQKESDNGDPDDDGTTPQGTTPKGKTPRGPSGTTPGDSFTTYPESHIDPLYTLDSGDDSGKIGIDRDGNVVVVCHGPDDRFGELRRIGDDGTITVDGPTSTGGTQLGGGTGGHGTGGGGGGAGSAGLGLGAGGAIALGGAKLIAAKGGSMGGGLGGGLLRSGGGLGSASGRLGSAGGGLGSAAETAGARGSGLGGSGVARAGSGGLLGQGGQAAASEGAAGGRGGPGMMGGGHGQGGRGEDKRKSAGLGGPIAPKLEEDEERGARSAGAGPGGRA